MLRLGNITYVIRMVSTRVNDLFGRLLQLSDHQNKGQCNEIFASHTAVFAFRAWKSAVPVL